MDGDIHIALKDATGDRPGTIVVEVPAKSQWCEIRKTVFQWKQTKFPFQTRANKTFKISKAQVITVVGKAFFDISHAPKDHSNRRMDLCRLRGLGNSSSHETDRF
jgi:hypothetical protein